MKATAYTNSPVAADKGPWISVTIIAVLVAVVYATLFGVYRCNLAIDATWYLAFSYHYCMKGIDSDAAFWALFPAGEGGTVAFGKVAAFLQCVALAPINWSLVAANVVSVVGVLLSMTVVFAFLVGEGFSRLIAVTCCLALAATGPFVGMANQSKYEYITFFLQYPACFWRRIATFSLPA